MLAQSAATRRSNYRTPVTAPAGHRPRRQPLSPNAGSPNAGPVEPGLGDPPPLLVRRPRAEHRLPAPDALVLAVPRPAPALVGVHQLQAADPAAVEQTQDDPQEPELEFWRVEASTGQGMAPGVYELRQEIATGIWIKLSRAS